jgi:hypothetical protein
MICEGCGMKLVRDFTFDDGTHFYMVCPNFESAFQEYMQMEWEAGSYEYLGTYPCERVYEIPVYYGCI